jgi:hypothetical protein
MKRLLAGVAVVSLAATLLVVTAAGAGAAVRTAADLAADCNDDGVVSITSDTTYVGGTGEITGASLVPGSAPICMIDVDAPTVTLKMKNVTLHGVDGARINIGQSSAADTTISIGNSVIETTGVGALAGSLSIKSDCCGGISGGLGATVNITSSSLRGSSVELGASLGAAANGRFTLKGTNIVADGDEFTSLADIVVVASDAGHGGDVTLQRNTFTAENGFSVEVGSDGRLSVTNNDFTGVGGTTVVHAGSASTCTTTGNTPAVVCT